MSLLSSRSGTVVAFCAEASLSGSAGGRAVSTEELRYGLHLSVVALPAPPQLTTAKALTVVGPGAFGMDGNVVYRPIGTYQGLTATVHPLRCGGNTC